MRKIMRESKDQIQERFQKDMSIRNKNADRLIEKWSKKKNLGEGLVELRDKDSQKARNLAFIMENQEKHLRNLTETQISNAFQTAPNNVMKIIRLSYPNSVRGEIFTEWGMETARDSIYYLKAVYGNSARSATAGNVMMESTSDRYPSEIELEEAAETPNDAITTFTGDTAGALANPPLRPYTVRVLVDKEYVGTDDGSGNISGSTITTGTVNYTNGAISVTFSSAVPTGSTVEFEYFYDSEQTSQYTDLGEVHLQLLDFLFRAKPWPIGVSWSKMTELLLGTTLNIDAEEAMLSGASDEFKKALDYQALRIGYRYANASTPVTFDANFATAGADSEVAHAQSVTKVFDEAGDAIYQQIGRGGVTAIYGGTKALNFIKLHRRFDASGAQPKVGAYKIGSLDGINLYKVPSDIVPENELVSVWKNEQNENDASIMFGTLIPLYATQTLEYKNFYKEQGLAYFGDYRVTQNKYIQKITMSGLS